MICHDVILSGLVVGFHTNHHHADTLTQHYGTRDRDEAGEGHKPATGSVLLYQALLQQLFGGVEWGCGGISGGDQRSISPVGIYAYIAGE